MLASFTGRKTGRHYRQPLSYVRDGDILLTPGGGHRPRRDSRGGRDGIAALGSRRPCRFQGRLFD